MIDTSKSSTQTSFIDMIRLSLVLYVSVMKIKGLGKRKNIVCVDDFVVSIVKSSVTCVIYECYENKRPRKEKILYAGGDGPDQLKTR